MYVHKLEILLLCMLHRLGRNPHMGHLALADDFIITADSVSMLSEACSNGYVPILMMMRFNLMKTAFKSPISRSSCVSTFS